MEGFKTLYFNKNLDYYSDCLEMPTEWPEQDKTRQDGEPPQGYVQIKGSQWEACKVIMWRVLANETPNKTWGGYNIKHKNRRKLQPLDWQGRVSEKVMQCSAVYIFPS